VNWHERSSRAVFTWQEPRWKGLGGAVSYEDRKSPTWNSGVQKAVRRGSAAQASGSCDRSLPPNQQVFVRNIRAADQIKFRQEKSMKTNNWWGKDLQHWYTIVKVLGNRAQTVSGCGRAREISEINVYSQFRPDTSMKQIRGRNQPFSGNLEKRCDTTVTRYCKHSQDSRQDGYGCKTW